MTYNLPALPTYLPYPHLIQACQSQAEMDMQVLFAEAGHLQHSEQTKCLFCVFVC